MATTRTPPSAPVAEPHPRGLRRMVLLRDRAVASQHGAAPAWPRAASVRRAAAAVLLGRPVLVGCPRWSAMRRVAGELGVAWAALGSAGPADLLDLRGARLPLGPPGWSRLLSRVVEVLHVAVPAALALPLRPEGLEHALVSALRRAPPGLLVVVGAEGLPPDALAALRAAFRAALDAPRRGLLLLPEHLARAAAAHGDEGVVRLADPSPVEAVALLGAWRRSLSPAEMRRVVGAVGVVPSFLDTLAAAPRWTSLADEVETEAGVLRLLGGVGSDAIAAVSRFRADDALAARLDRLRSGALPSSPVDAALRDAGLVRTLPGRVAVGGRFVALTALRSPLFGG